MASHAGALVHRHRNPTSFGTSSFAFLSGNLCTCGVLELQGAFFPPSNAEVAIQTTFGPFKVQQVSR
ncbi:hypothetical protein COLO4_33807 [Corchorus olitorius]|uniref:Uncharacterized protein n=1 Tax=Corchorus olitorius TaxID=93759 RepID=A0A1R3GR80_9ROSI|nr:hypothetical protein COLO4_33807 [Corchorus olitorius]